MTNGSLEKIHRLFQSTVVRPGTTCAGTKLSLLIETHIVHTEGLGGYSHKSLPRQCQQGYWKLKFQKCGCPRSNNTVPTRY
mgnify:CR=1 FL=1